MPLQSPGYHLRIFVICLAVVVVALLGVLFGVLMEGITHASGVIEVRDVHEVRAPFAGLVELGWYEGEVFLSERLLPVRLDRQGNGMSDPSQGEVRRLKNFRCKEGAVLTVDQLRLHKLRAGDIVWPEQVVVFVRAEENQREMLRWKAKLEDLEARKETNRETQVRYQTLRDLLAQAPVQAPADKPAWKVLKVHVSQGQAVSAGDVLVQLAPVNAKTSLVEEWIAQLDVPERHAAGLELGQEVRLYSALYNQRLHGHAEGTVERIEPIAEPSGSTGERQVRAQVKVTKAPFALQHGSGVKAEIVLGHKRVYRIILEQ